MTNDNTVNDIPSSDNPFVEYECCFCFEPLDFAKKNTMVISYIYNQYAHISCYWQNRLDRFIPKESLQDLMITIIDKDGNNEDEIVLSGIVMDALNAVIPTDMQRQVVDSYNRRFVEYCSKKLT